MIENKIVSSVKLSVSMATNIFRSKHNFVIFFPFKIASFNTSCPEFVFINVTNTYGFYKTQMPALCEQRKSSSDFYGQPVSDLDF